jgi:hypothetical protein
MRFTPLLAIVGFASTMALAVAACFPGYEVGAPDGGSDAALDSAPVSNDGAAEASPGADAGPDAQSPDGVASTDAREDSGTIAADASDAAVHFVSGAIGPSNSDISATSSPATSVGDLLLICAFIEPAGEMTDAATYGTFTPPGGFTLATWEPISSNDARLAAGGLSNRQYLWWGYATVAGAQQYSITAPSSGFHFADTVIITVKGYATSGNPFADTPSTATYGDGPTVGQFPSVSVTPAAAGTGFLWFGTSWDVGSFGYPTGYSDLLHQSTLSLSSFDQGAPATQTVAPVVAPTNLLTAALMTFR